jgi:hypothetical protein
LPVFSILSLRQLRRDGGDGDNDISTAALIGEEEEIGAYRDDKDHEDRHDCGATAAIVCHHYLLFERLKFYSYNEATSLFGTAIST